MLASTPYAASKAWCQLAKQSNLAQYRSRSENSKPKKKSHSCRMGSMAPPILIQLLDEFACLPEPIVIQTIQLLKSRFASVEEVTRETSQDVENRQT